MSFRELFYPTKKKLAVFFFIFLTASFPLYSIWTGDVATYDQERSPWINQFMMVWGFTSIIGAIFQSPLTLFSQLFPGLSNQDEKILSTILILLNSYIQGSLIGAIWEQEKTKQERKYLKYYVGGVAAAFVVLLLLSIGESSNDLPLLTAGSLGLFLLVFFTKRLTGRIFIPVFILTILFSAGFFGLALSDFEESYCWNYKNGPDSEFKDHMDCHKKFNLYKALSETY